VKKQETKQQLNPVGYNSIVEGAFKLRRSLEKLSDLLKIEQNYLE